MLKPASEQYRAPLPVLLQYCNIKFQFYLRISCANLHFSMIVVFIHLFCQWADLA